MAASTGSQPSHFLEPTAKTAPNTLAIISLSKENFQPITLQQSDSAVDGYAEGVTLNTRFGSFPHSTLLDIPWGSQVRASVVDTGSRGRKRRRDEVEDEETPTSNQDDGNDTPSSAPAKRAVVASSGFIYVLRPTPELWTSSLPHRTQVVYTPDYSYVLQRIRARPGSRIIEAGAGSGSFTHASARAVYNGYPKSDADLRGKVFSFEFHELRYEKMQAELKHHALDGVVQLTHRDVYDEGFLINGQSPKASAIFLDLPAPWEALHHLARRKTLKGGKLDDKPGDWESPLDPNRSAFICTFSPCIEQVTRTVTEMRTLGWTDIDMVEIANHRFNVMRDRVGVNIPNEKGFSSQPGDVGEAVKKLKSDLKRTQDFHKGQTSQLVSDASESKMDVDGSTPESSSKDSNKSEDPLWLQGRVVHRTENDLKTHTSYLVFAILPREWDEAAEEAAMARWPCGSEGKTIGNLDKQTRKQEKREMLAGRKRKKQSDDTQTTQ
ncbi:tRNA (adenine-N(1)-)-methyltransferase catalytic subunit trm61 [Pochonia chlamydosporia 170]|uniref:tRNA (adenine(58)-N(1))-methyltransferase catalytic subunit TRM61 n=1 Tax=Pochonia chlamydosporia 170 TaxID=1380566 RepID=A0A179FHN5_METCM|nr:tRNA (adenine-N(1)-)-methyltransferase catalytic subunit trm61 [Pochonia chlamydosporia 170]OAQ65054.1 tRNA (adenine-N(1)-)-methyltransferase catalytic subunit trm61 [Pochonia chlamydosporia 170]